MAIRDIGSTTQWQVSGLRRPGVTLLPLQGTGGGKALKGFEISEGPQGTSETYPGLPSQFSLLGSKETTTYMCSCTKSLPHTGPVREGPQGPDELPEETGLEQMVPGPGHLLAGKWWDGARGHGHQTTQ